ncbi:sensor histidine kinase [Paenibacillus nanensis]|nr:HAMP domain-containing sensor histidine kinase [Paenibacillus nanensis]
MKRGIIGRRLTLHFIFQMLLLFAFVLVAVTTIFLLLSQIMVNEDLKRTFPVGSLDAIIMDTLTSENQAEVPKHWERQLKEHQYWLQVVNSKGEVVYSANAPDDLPRSYAPGELLRMQETKRYGPYDVMIKLDNSVPKSVLFMMGFKNEGAVAVETLFEQYASGGVVGESDMARLNEELRQSQRSLQIINSEGEALQSFGEPYTIRRYEPLELIRMKELQGDYPTQITVYLSEETDTYWILHQARLAAYERQPLLKEIITWTSIIGGFVLAVTIAFSIYHGYRYGKPLLLFISWFRRLGSGQYGVMQTETERKKLYRKNGKLRRKYKLYKEVIDGFNEMTARLNEAEQDRIRLEKTREEWMTGISHDLRTPLSSIQGYGHLLESGQYSWTDEELQAMGATIRDKSDYMIELIQDFSLAFQLKNKKVPFEVHSVELREFVRRTVLRYVNDITMERVAFRYEEDDAPVWISANDKWFARMLDNVLMNAVRHNPDGTTVTVRVGTAEGQAVVSVNDDGVGMDEETLRNLFERYYRGTNTEEQTAGGGLGMSIARSIALAHHGSIEAESKPGEGTTVTLRFPADARKPLGSGSLPVA